MASHIASDATHKQFPYTPKDLEASTIGDEEKAIFELGEKAWRSSKKGDKRKTPEAKAKGKAFRHQMRAEKQRSTEKAQRKEEKRALQQGAKQGEQEAGMMRILIMHSPGFQALTPPPRPPPKGAGVGP